MNKNRTRSTHFTLHPLTRAVALALLAGASGALQAQSLPAGTLPTGGAVSAGSGSIAQAGAAMTVNQATQNLSINWQSFSIGKDASVNFVQPNASAIVLNRVIGTEGSKILGSLSANGQVFLINPNGVLFGRNAQVDVGGLVASTLDLSDADFLGGRRTFGGSGGKVVNKGTINAAPGGYVALIGGQVSNRGTITAQLGTVALGAGSKVTLDFAGDKLLNLRVDEGALKALAENKQLIRADGGTVILSGRATDALVGTVVNNEGVIEARTVENRNGTIVLLGGMDKGTVNVGGTLDASAPNGGDGGFIETSGAKVKFADNLKVTTDAPQGATGTWLIDPTDFTIAASGGDRTPTQIQTDLATTNVIVQTVAAGAGNGDIFVNNAISWTGNNDLTLRAHRNINVNANISATGTTAVLNLEFGQGAVNAGNTADYILASGVKINLAAGDNFTTKLGTDGTLKTYRVITALGNSGSTTGTDLQGMRGSTANLNRNYALGADINAANTATTFGASGFNPIGGATGSYNGTFTGLGHTVTNLRINRPTLDLVGLFGRISTTATVRNVSVGGTITGRDYVGGLVGLNQGLILNARASAAVVTGENYVGGVVGDNWGTVTASNATAGTVTGIAYYIGGLGGRNYLTGVVNGNSYAEGTVVGLDTVGGLVGLNNGQILNANASATVVQPADGSYHDRIGGLVGVNTGSIISSYALGAVSGDSYVGGLVGDNSGTITTSYAKTGAVTGNYSYIGGLAGRNDTTGVVNGSYAEGQVNANWDGGGLVGVNAGLIDRSRASGSLIGGDELGGLVGTNDTGATISNSYATGAVSGFQKNLGGLAGINRGSVTSSYATGDVAGQQNAGGLVGQNEGSIADAYAWGRATVSINSAGGLAGINSGSINRAYAKGLVTGPQSGGLVGSNSGTLTQVFWDTQATGKSNAVSSGAGTLTGVVGATTAQLQQAAPQTFYATNATTWNFASTWFAPGGAYPLLRNSPYLLIVTYADSHQTYGSVNLAGLAPSYSGLVGADTSAIVNGLLISTLATPASGVGVYAISGSGATAASVAMPGQNYTIAYQPGTLTIDPALLTVTGTRQYDGTTSAAAGTLMLSGLVGSETLGLSGSATFGGSANAGSRSINSISGLALSNGTGLAANYSLSSGGAFTVTQRALNVDGSRVYDGSANVSAGVLTLGGLIGGQTLVLSGAGQMADANAGTNKTLGQNTLALADGTGLASNYTLTGGVLRATINPYVVNLTGARPYDGTTVVAGSDLALPSLPLGETLGLTGAGSVTSKNVGTLKPVTLGSLALTSGTGLAGNYTLTGGTQTVDITQANITLTTGNVTKTYDATTSANGTATVASGTLFAGDSLSGGSFAFTDANAGSGTKAVTTSGVTVGDGVNNGNYNVSYANNTTSTINPFAVQVGGIRDYDGTTTVDAAALFTILLPAGEFLTLSGAATVASRNVGRRNLNLSGLTLGHGSGLASNYTLAGGSGTVDIIRANLTLSTSDVTKVYDGTTAALGVAVATAGTVLFGTDTATGGSFAFTDRNAGAANKRVTVSGITVNDGNNGNNYNISLADNTSSTINRAPLTIAADNKSKAQGDANPALTAVATGLLAGDSNALITGLSTPASAASGAGVYVIDASAAGAGGNYMVMGTSNGTLTISPSAVAIPVETPGATDAYRSAVASAHDNKGKSAGVQASDNLPLTIEAGGVLLPPGVGGN